MLPFLAAAAFACNSLTVDAPQSYSFGFGSGRTFVADFDGDGRPDVANGRYEPATFSIRFNLGGGHLSEAVSFPYPVMAVADVVGDALPDLVVYQQGVRENRGGRDFSNSIHTVAMVAPALAADFTGDGKADVLTQEGLRHALYSFAGGSARKVSQLDMGEFRRDPEAIDVDGDGDLDVIAGYDFGADYRVFTNDGRGNFTAGRIRKFDGWFSSADVDRDGRADRVGIVLDDGVYRGLRVFYANGTSAEVAVPEGARASAFRLFDFDLDGDVDLVISVEDRAGGWLYRNDGGRFTAAPRRLMIGSIAAVADFTGDGIPDVLQSNQMGSVAIVRGKGDGTFNMPPTLDLPAGSRFTRPIAFDLEGNGLDELIYVNKQGRVVVARPDGIGGFTVELLPPSASGYALRASRDEIAVADYNDRISIFTRRTSGWALSRFFEPTTPAPDYQIEDFELADLNGDGKNELAVIGRIGETASLRVVDSSRRALLDQPLAPGQAAYELFVHGRLLVVTLSGTAKTTLGDPPLTEVLPDGRVTTYSFRASGIAQQTVMAQSVFGSTVAGDFNGDGYVDVLSGSLLAYGRAAGTFAPPESVEGISHDRVVGDLNGDGVTDLVAYSFRGFTYHLGSRSGLQRAAGDWRVTPGGLPAIARLRAERPASLIFGAEDLVEVKTHCIAPVGRRRGVRH